MESSSSSFGAGAGGCKLCLNYSGIRKLWDSMNLGESRFGVCVVGTVGLCQLPCGMRGEQSVSVCPHVLTWYPLSLQRLSWSRP